MENAHQCAATLSQRAERLAHPPCATFSSQPQATPLPLEVRVLFSPLSPVMMCMV